MTGSDLHAALTELGHTQQSFADYLGVHRVTVNEWCKNRPEPPRYVERIVELLRQRAHDAA